MHITFCPIRSDETLTLERVGDALVVNGDLFDFSTLPDGAENTPASSWFTGPVRRESAVLYVEIALPHGPQATKAQRFPEPVIQTSDGPVALP